MKNNKELMNGFDRAYAELCKWDMRSITNDNPSAALVYLVFLKYTSDNKERLGLEFFEKYNFDYLVLLFKDKIEHNELVNHVASIEKQLGFENGIMESFANDIDLKKFSEQTTIVLEILNALDLSEDEGNTTVYDTLSAYLSLQSKRELRFANNHITDINLAKLMAKLTEIDDNMTLYDFASGYGFTLAETAKGKDVQVFAQDIDKESAAVSIMLMTMIGKSGAKVCCDDSITNPLTADSNINTTFDRVISVPPFGIRLTGENATLKSGKQANAFEYGLGYRLNGDLVFARHTLASLSSNGIGVLMLPSGVLFRSGVDKEIRSRMIEDNYIDAVIEMPSGIVAGTRIETSLIIFRKSRKNEDIYMLDLTKDQAKDYVESAGRTGIAITGEGIDAISNLVLKRKEVEGLSRLVERREILKNDANLCAGVYIEQPIEDSIEVEDITGILEESSKLYRELLDLDNRYNEVVRELRIDPNSL